MTFRRGFSIPELLVSMVVFMGMMVVILTLLHQNRRAAQKVDSHTDSTAQAMLVFEKVRNEVHKGRVVGIDNGTLEYWISRKSTAGVPMANSDGRVDWLPGEPANPDVARLYAQEGVLWRDFQGVRQPLAPLGPDGDVQFEWNPGFHMLTVIGQVGQTDAYEATRQSLHKFRYQMNLTNNE